MSSQARTIGVILAGGTGSRVGLSIPKQLLKIAGRPVMEHTLAIFQDADVIDEIFIMMHPDHLAAADAIAARFSKVTRVINGGGTRNDTSFAAIAALGEDADPDIRLLFHDAVRPLLDTRIINDLVAALDDYDAVDVAIPSADTIIEVNANDEIVDIPDRSRLRRGQTPQAFRLGTLRKAYLIARQDADFVPADDCSVILKYLPGEPIAVVRGADHNMKITEPIDVFIADKLFQIGSTVAPAPTSVEEYTAGLAGKAMVVLGGSYGIGGDIVEMARGFGAEVRSYSRSQTGTDVSRPEDIRAALADAHAELGRIDFVVLTAGILNRGRLADVPMEEILEGIRVNYFAPVLTARFAHEYLKETAGHLVFFTSSSYTRGRADYSVYSSTKAAVVNLTQALADEWSAEGIQVNVINPERAGTPMRTRAFGKEPEGSLLSSQAVALTTIDVLLSSLTGHVIDVRREEPGHVGMSRSELEATRIAEALAEAGEGDEG
ncbi:SDR family NAD(P)-dependent oxidoreductase [Propionicimonas sp.]|uniref:SDR family NAD(P)-dependent oxidoreductase n=1 Tax=Propionicimonas sp. TaxID=1955623 RepID=UPI0039E388B8